MRWATIASLPPLARGAVGAWRELLDGIPLSADPWASSNGSPRRGGAMTDGRALADGLETLDSLSVAVLTDDVSDNYVSKTPFAASEFGNVVRAGVRVISGEALLCANLGYGLRLVSNAGGQRHTLLFDTGPEPPVYIR